MAVVGQQLLQPESGWKRYNDNHPSLKFENFVYTSSVGGYYGGDTSHTTVNGGSIQFLFIGTKLRLITGIVNPNRSDNIEVYIDGVFDNKFSAVSSGSTNQILSYEKSYLAKGIHKVEIVNKSSNAYNFDAIDIDSEGRLLHPDEVLKPSELDIGKRIRCHYQASSNTVGTFSNLGQETYKDGINDFIPPTSSATPNGDFYYICVDKDHLGRWKLIADRNIQHSISWDTLNTSGIASGSGLPTEISGVSSKPNFTTRLLTGGISSSDKDNEWDKYIVGSNLGGNIIAGDNAVWNWNAYGLESWTSTTPNGKSLTRVRRGLINDVSLWDGSDSGSSYIGSYGAFRPVLLIEISTINKSFILLNGEYKKFNGQWQTISKTLPSLDTFKNEGMDDLSVFDRKETKFVTPMDNNTLQGEVLGEGRMFRETIDLKKYFDIVKIDVK